MTKVLENKASASGNVKVENDKIIWEYQGQIISVIDLIEVAVIGEYTTANGPWLDDWFLVFVKKDASFSHIPFYVDGRESMINFIQSQLNSGTVIGALVGSTHWKSVIDYPKELEGQPLFRLQPTNNHNPPKTWVAKILYGIGLGNYDTDEEIFLASQVEEYIKNASS